MRKKLAFVGTPDYPIPAIRGGAIQTLVTALIDKNEEIGEYDIVVYTIYDSEINTIKFSRTEIVGIRQSFLGKIKLFVRKVLRRLTNNRISYRSEYMSKINKELLKKKYDYVIFETTDKEVVQLDPRVKRTAKILYHIHADYINDNTDRISNIADLVDVFVGVSDFISFRLRNVKALENAKIVTLYNAIEENKIEEDERSEWRKKVRLKYGLKDSDMVFLYCSRLSPEKGCLELEKALLKLDKKAKLLVIGGTNFNSNAQTKYLRTLQNLASNNKGRIHYTGAIEHKLVNQYMVAADIAVVPSVCNEAASLTLLEFRSLELPTIATNIGGIPEFTNSESTVLVDYDSDFIDNLSKAMNKVMNDLDLRKSLQINTKKDMSKFYYSSYYHRFKELINSLGYNNDNEEFKR